MKVKTPITTDGNSIEGLATFSKTGDLAVGTGTFKFVMPYAATLVSVTLTAGTSPTGAAILVDVNKNGTTIFTTQGNRPTLAAGTTVGSASATPNVTAMAAGDYLTVDIDQVGSTLPGTDLLVQIRYRS
jgi:hypothetical protein